MEKLTYYIASFMKLNTMWLIDKLTVSFEEMVANVLKCGPIPNHLAVIMDGNRRYARQKKLTTFKGHEKGSETAENVFKWCKYLGIKEATFYVFSIENFKRSKQEVDDLMTFLKQWLERCFEDRKELMKEGIRIRVIGNLELLNEELLESIRKLTLETRNNSIICINLAIAYTSRDEISSAVKSAMQTQQKEVDLIEGTENLISRKLYIDTKVDLMIRTSGESRLSDFLLWQSVNAILSFTNVLWPDVTFWHLSAIILDYQKNFAINSSNLKLNT